MWVTRPPGLHMLHVHIHSRAAQTTTTLCMYTCTHHEVQPRTTAHPARTWIIFCSFWLSCLSSGRSKGYAPTSITYSITPHDQMSAIWVGRGMAGVGWGGEGRWAGRLRLSSDVEAGPGLCLLAHPEMPVQGHCACPPPHAGASRRHTHEARTPPPGARRAARPAAAGARTLGPSLIHRESVPPRRTVM